MTYSLSDFDQVPSTKEIVLEKVDLNALPSLDTVKMQARWTSDMSELFSRDGAWFAPPDKQDRSAALARLAYSGAEMGWSDEQIATVLYDADDRWEKYTGRKSTTRNNIILNFIQRAREKHGYVQMGEIDLSKFAKAADPQDPESVAEPLIYGFQDFVNADFHVDWMLDGLLALGGFGFILGYPGTGKTQLCLQMAAQLALGEPRFLKWDNTGGKKRKVLFLSLEMGKAPLNLFLTTIGQSYKDKATLNRNFLVAPFGVPLPLDTEPGQKFLNNLLDEFMPDIIFIDSLQKVISKEMTDELAIKNLMGYLQVIRDKYRTAVVVIHHNRKKSNEAQKKDLDLNEAYGSYLIGAEAEFMLSLKKTEIAGMLTLEQLKNRLGPEQPPFEVTRDEHLHFTIDFDDVRTKFQGKDEDGKSTVMGIG